MGGNGEDVLVDILQREVLYPKNVIEKRVRELASTISRDYVGKELIVILFVDNI